jgi:hypothetical protein
MSTKGLHQLRKKPDVFSLDAKSIFITAPCFGNLVTVDFMQSMINVQSWAAKKYIPIRFYWLGRSAIITEARNRCVAEFLNDNDHYSHFLFVDADVAFGVETLEKLLEADKDVAVAPYPNKSIDWAWQEFRTTNDPHAEYDKAGLTFNVVFENQDNGKSTIQPNEDGFLKVRRAPTGMMLIKREVFTRLIEAPYPYRVQPYKDVDNTKNMYGFFDVMTLKSGYRLGEDFAFCERVQAASREIWALCTANMRHEGATKFTGNFQEQIKTIALLRKTDDLKAGIKEMEEKGIPWTVGKKK